MSNTRTSGALTVSIVSHGHGRLIAPLLEDLVHFPEVMHLVLTYNVPEEPIPIPSRLISRTEITVNPAPVGFGENHNAAFKRARTELFCVMNPDIRLPRNPFPVLLSTITAPGAALAAPAVVSPAGAVECTARRFPLPHQLLLKMFNMYDGGVPFQIGAPPIRPDWVTGTFMLLKSHAFAQVGGFDTKFHMYYEDVDLCARLLRAHHDVLFCPEATVVHAARRASHRDPRFMAWHLRSMVRYFSRYIGRLPTRQTTP